MPEDLNWVERHRVTENNIPLVWERLCVDLQDAVQSFNREYGHRQDANVEVYRKNGCLQLSYKPASRTSLVQPRSMVVYLEGKTVKNDMGIVLYLIGDENGTPRICIDQEGKETLTNDQASEKLLKSFLRVA